MEVALALARYGRCERVIKSPSEVLGRVVAGGKVGAYALAASDLKPGRTGREVYFNLFLVLDGELSSRPVVQGLFFAGRGDFIRAWIEFRYDPRAVFPGGRSVDLEEEGLTGELFSLLGELMPPGGSMMVIYGAEPHPLFRETERGLKRGFPPQVTPLGHHLWEIGLRWFKDWYFPEGWLEGSMKLQATRPLNDGIRVEREARAREELALFVRKMRDRGASDLERSALARAEEILAALAANA